MHSGPLAYPRNKDEKEARREEAGGGLPTVRSAGEVRVASVQRQIVPSGCWRARFSTCDRRVTESLLASTVALLHTLYSNRGNVRANTATLSRLQNDTRAQPMWNVNATSAMQPPN